MEKFYQYLWQPDALTQTESRQRRRLEARQCRPLLDQPRCSYIIRVLYAHGAAHGDMEKAEAGRCLECRLCHWLLRSKERNLQRIMQNVFLFLRLNIDKAMFFC